MDKLKTLYLSNEITRIERQLESYILIYEGEEVKSLTLKRLIDLKKRELVLLRDLLDNNV